jgi:hypothetical protein
MSTSRVKRVSRTSHIKKPKRSINPDTWSNIKELVKTRKLQKIQQKQMFYEKFSNISKIFETRASSLNSTLNEKTIITSVPKNSEPGKMFELYIDGSLVNVKCPEYATPGSKILLKIKKTRNIYQELKELIKLRRMYKIAYDYGIYYGYPMCCINDFIIRLHNKQCHEPIQELASMYTGFVPCMKCSEKISKKKIDPKDILKNRKCKHTFPLDDEPGHAFPCKKHALLIFLKKITMDQAISSGCKNCYVSPKDDEDEEADEDEDESEVQDEEVCCSRCKH